MSLLGKMHFLRVKCIIYQYLRIVLIVATIWILIDVEGLDPNLREMMAVSLGETFAPLVCETLEIFG
jgi:hypothetical protein